MEKNNKKLRLKQNRKLFALSFLSFAALSAVAIAPVITTNSQSLIETNLTSNRSLNASNSRTVQTENFEIWNYGSFAEDNSPEGTERFRAIQNVYRRTPSELSTDQIGTIVNVLGTFPNPPVIENLSRHPAGSALNNDSPLAAFAGQENANIMTPNYLNENGILAFAINATTPAGVAVRELFMISGFRSRIIETTLPGEVYQFNVNEVPDSQLPTFINFEQNLLRPTSITLVENTRVNNSETGDLSFRLNLNYAFPVVADFAIEPGSDVIATRGETNYQVALSYPGFQPASALSTQSLINLILIILAVVAGVVAVSGVVAVVIMKKSAKYK